MPDNPGGADRPPSPRGSYDSTTTPADLKVRIAEQSIRIDWKDGKTSEFPLGMLRRHCPCATCRSERERQDDNPLRILKFDPSTLRVTNARLVGSYAIQFYWSDGHDTGIFDFRFLRSLGTNKV